eukprot:1609299-Rhodomonas_salina.3
MSGTDKPYDGTDKPYDGTEIAYGSTHVMPGTEIAYGGTSALSGTGMPYGGTAGADVKYGGTRGVIGSEGVVVAPYGPTHLLCDVRYRPRGCYYQVGLVGLVMSTLRDGRVEREGAEAVLLPGTDGGSMGGEGREGGEARIGRSGAWADV